MSTTDHGTHIQRYKARLAKRAARKALERDKQLKPAPPEFAQIIASMERMAARKGRK